MVITSPDGISFLNEAFTKVCLSMVWGCDVIGNIHKRISPSHQWPPSAELPKINLPNLAPISFKSVKFGKEFNMPLGQGENEKLTYQDYLGWPEDERWEIIDGKAYNMTPAPSTLHQRILVRLVGFLEKALHSTPCTVFIAPTDVVLSEEDVVQPDLLLVCDGQKISRSNI